LAADAAYAAVGVAPSASSAATTTPYASASNACSAIADTPTTTAARAHRWMLMVEEWVVVCCAG
jgi:hypothetical protein